MYCWALYQAMYTIKKKGNHLTHLALLADRLPHKHPIRVIEYVPSPQGSDAQSICQCLEMQQLSPRGTKQFYARLPFNLSLQSNSAAVWVQALFCQWQTNYGHVKGTSMSNRRELQYSLWIKTIKHIELVASLQLTMSLQKKSHQLLVEHFFRYRKLSQQIGLC